VTEGHRRIDQVLDPGFVSEIESLDWDELRRRRDLAEEVEHEMSYYRRLLHGRMDLLAFESRRRKGEETRSLIEALPEILTGHDRTGEARGRHLSTAVPELPVSGKRAVDRVLGADVLVRLAELDEEALATASQELHEVEEEISNLRRQVQAVVDRLQAEIVDRYKADPALQS
jgi:hypothetical protein